MPGLYLNEYDFSVNTHTILTTNDLLTQLLNVQDNNGAQIYQTAERMRPNPTSLYKEDAPYALLEIFPMGYDTTGQGTITRRHIEARLHLVFRIGAQDSGNNDVDLQAYGDGLAALTLSYLQPQLADNPNGMAPPLYPHLIEQPLTGLQAELWNYAFNTKFKDNIDRKISTWNPLERSKIDGSRYAVHLQLAITVNESISLENA